MTTPHLLRPILAACVATLVAWPASGQEDARSTESLGRLIRALESEDSRVVADATKKLMTVRRAAEKPLVARMKSVGSNRPKITARLRRILTICRIDAEPVRGLLIGLDVEPKKAEKESKVTFRTTLANITDKPLVVPAGIDILGNIFATGLPLVRLVPPRGKHGVPKPISPVPTDGLMCGTGAQPIWVTVPPYDSLVFTANAKVSKKALKLPKAMSEFPLAKRKGAHSFRFRLLAMTDREIDKFVKDAERAGAAFRLPELNPDPVAAGFRKMLGIKPPVPNAWHGKALSNVVVLTLR